MNIKILLALMILTNSCQGQNRTNMELKNDALLCDTSTGMCELPANRTNDTGHKMPATQKPVKLIYFTDPICSSCWGIEPQLRRLKLEYGKDVEIEYHMGGLLPDWSYNSGGISKPSDVAHHWNEVSRHYKMPIDGDVWLEDPLSSSFPPSIAFKAAEMQDKHKAVVFLRKMREMVFLQKKNITKWQHIAEAAVLSGLDTAKLKTDYEGDAKRLFQADLDLAAKMGVRGFPTIFVTDTTGRTEMVYGSKPYAMYENTIQNMYKAAAKASYSKKWEDIFAAYPTLTTREFAELSDITMEVAEPLLADLVQKNKLTSFKTKNGALWIKK